MKASSFSQMAWQIGLLVSSLLGGALLKWVGVSFACLAAAGLNMGAALLLLPFIGGEKKIPQRLSLNDFKQSPFRLMYEDFTEGLKYLRQKPELVVLAMPFIINLPMFEGINTLVGPFNRRLLKGDEFTLGLLEAMGGLGGLLSSFICLRLNTKKAQLIAVVLATISLTIALNLFVKITSFTSACGMYVFFGIFLGVSKVISRAILLNELQAQYSGRFMMAISTYGLILGVGSSAICGLVADHDLKWSYFLLSMVAILAAIAAGQNWLKANRAMQFEHAREVGLLEL